MLSIAKEKEIRNLLSLRPKASSKSIASLAGVSRTAINRVRHTVEMTEELGEEKVELIRKLLLQGLSVEAIKIAALVSEESALAVQCFYFLHLRKSGHPIDLCPTCGSMMFDEDHRLRRTVTKKSGRMLPPIISEEQAVKLYRNVVDLCELERLCIITNPLFYYLARRAKITLGEIYGDK